MPRIHDPELIRYLTTIFAARNEASYSWGNALSVFTLLPKLRGLWFCGDVDENGAVPDHSGQGRTLTAANTPTYGLSILAPHATYVRASSQEHYRADEPGLDITSALTAFAWVRFTANSTGVYTGILTKFVSAGNQRSFAVVKNSTNVFQFLISSTGAATAVTLSSTASYVVGQWYFVTARYDPSTIAAISVNATHDSTAAAIPASLFNSSANLRAGAHDGGNFLDGDIAVAGMANFYFPDYLIKALYDKTRRMFGV